MFFFPSHVTACSHDQFSFLCHFLCDMCIRVELLGLRIATNIWFLQNRTNWAIWSRLICWKNSFDGQMNTSEATKKFQSWVNASILHCFMLIDNQHEMFVPFSQLFCGRPTLWSSDPTPQRWNLSPKDLIVHCACIGNKKWHCVTRAARGTIVRQLINWEQRLIAFARQVKWLPSQWCNCAALWTHWLQEIGWTLCCWGFCASYSS